MIDIIDQPIEVSIINLPIDIDLKVSSIQVDVSMPLLSTRINQTSVDVSVQNPIIDVEVIQSNIQLSEDSMFKQFLRLGEDIEAYKAVSLIDNLIYKSTVDNLNRYDVIGILLESGLTNQLRLVQTGGVINNSNWNWIPNNQNKIYLSTDGNLIQAIPSSNIFIEIGYPITPTSMFIDIEEPIVL